MRETVMNIVLQGLKSICADSDIRLDSPGTATVLYGPGGLLDSIGIVALVAEIEQLVSRDLGRSVTLADDRSMSMKHSPFATVGALVDYILTLTGEKL
ncbi:MAG: hypothetical protein PHQ23_11850 [Candidatus Wallbacteria bacterium]|nr:hypothetical protein [Candidatus Wallbacteria bacterium]